jgi:hypothetical protein
VDEASGAQSFLLHSNQDVSFVKARAKPNSIDDYLARLSADNRAALKKLQLYENWGAYRFSGAFFERM